MFNPTAPINETLAEYSNLFMLIAALVYAVAFIVFTVDMALSSATIKRLEEELAAERQGAGARTRDRELAVAGAGRAGGG
ncbi:MAG: c-type cytochrome biogenesis protein CcsB, partial [Micrococcus sp.]|nr:c-type cytochrome biogenesis protein CcsB [Micrococcus sp.]